MISIDRKEGERGAIAGFVMTKSRIGIWRWKEKSAMGWQDGALYCKLPYSNLLML